VTGATYVRYELLRSIRNKRNLILTLGFPVILYLAIASSNRHVSFDGTSFPLYFMTAMGALGTMAAVLTSGAALATERQVGWTRQMRITPLTTRAYFGSKVLTGYLRALFTLVVLIVAGTLLGVRLSAGSWAELVGLMIVGLVPFVILGIVLGHVLAADSVGPSIGGIVSLFSLLGGAYGFELAKSGPLFQIMKALPSYWLVQAGKTALGGGAWPAEGWIVVALWSAALLPLAVFAYRRDTSRV